MAEKSGKFSVLVNGYMSYEELAVRISAIAEG